ncbi:hypothetical protein [Rhodobacter maris]|uniref:Uncharacterized protein n=1 Tax=Rhodobacter maris TaxID=446682 RepID=A0A285SZ62_9RHOB|nr:hypothetical protein [Rhodobacter maris]SOC14089.1 hypothetical protein SAMN05877831_11188 [Rhodobacter maris]
MWGPLLSFAGMASMRTALGLFGIGLWLMSRPGGWAVVVAAILVGVKLLPTPAEKPLETAAPAAVSPAEAATEVARSPNQPSDIAKP